MVRLAESMPAPRPDTLAAEVAYLRGRVAALERNLLEVVAHGTGQPARTPKPLPPARARAAAAWNLPFPREAG